MEEKVIAVTVTYNDSEYLVDCIKYLKKQTHPVQKILIVDNHSADEHRKKIEKLRSDKVEVLTLRENLGGAGGFEIGMRRVFQKDSPDWIWIMDADACPKEDCLQTLLSHKAAFPNTGILAPLIYGKELRKYQFYHHKKLAKYLDIDYRAFNDVKDVPETALIDANAFVGPLISKQAIEQLGYPDGSLFIYGDDLEYTYRISRRMSLVLVRDAIIYHRDKMGDGKKQPEDWWKDYFYYRNRILFVKKYGKGFWGKMKGTYWTIRHVGKEYVSTYKMSYEPKMLAVRRKILLAGLLDGLQGKKGIGRKHEFDL